MAQMSERLKELEAIYDQKKAEAKAAQLEMRCIFRVVHQKKNSEWGTMAHTVYDDEDMVKLPA